MDPKPLSIDERERAGNLMKRSWREARPNVYFAVQSPSSLNGRVPSN